MKISTGFTYSKILFSKENDNHLVLSLEAPALKKTEKRIPICVIPVIDVSSSMNGPKLDYARKSVIKLIDHLQPGDFCGVVTFGDDVRVISKPVEITQSKKDALKAEVGRIYSNGCTNFSGGLLEALALGNKLDVASDMIVRVIMFTDGHANRGIAAQPAQILELAKKNRDRVTVSAFGYGEDCNQEFLASLGAESAGNYAFVQNPEDAMTAFAKELGGLVSLHAQDIEITLAPAQDHTITGVISDVDVEDVDNKVVIKVPELLAEEKRHLVVEMKFAEQKQAFPRAVNVAEVALKYFVIEDGKRIEKTENIKVKLEFVKDGEQSTGPDKKLDQIVGLAQLVNAQIEAEKLAQRGQYNQAGSVLRAVGQTVADRGWSEIGNLADGISVNYATAASYGTSKGYRNSTSKLMSRSYGASSSDSAAVADVSSILFSAGMSMSNSSQNSTVSSFVDDQGPGNDLAPVAGSIVIPAVSLDDNKQADPGHKASKKSAKKGRSGSW